ncbi:MAG: hypothetical protein E6Q46_03370 [Flavobacterium sp.]|nr:MAG: hypothetical protein E6Q46_03370 [Flavobacterium sp.]
MNSKIKVLIKNQFIFYLFFLSLPTFAQNHRYEPYYGLTDGSLGLKSLVVGGIIWGIGMLIGYGLKKNESGTVKSGQSIHTGIVGVLCIGGMLIALFGLIMLGIA